MHFLLGTTNLFVRGLHVSSIKGQIEFREELVLELEDGNVHDSNAIKVSNSHGVFIGHVAREQTVPFRNLLRKSVDLNIQTEVIFIRTEREEIKKTNGSRYQSDRTVIQIEFFARCSLGQHQHKIDEIAMASQSTDIVFVRSTTPRSYDQIANELWKAIVKCCC